MHKELISLLKPISPEEQEILSNKVIRKDLYSSDEDFIVDSKKLLGTKKMINIRPHTRFIAFPKHKHNYIEIIYMCSGKSTHIINDTTKIILGEGELLFLNQHCFHEILPAGLEDIAVNFVVMPEFFDVAFNMLKEKNAISDFIISSLKTEGADASFLHFKVTDIVPVQNLIENLIWGIIKKEENEVHINQLTMGLLFVQLLKYTNLLAENNSNEKTFYAVKAINYIEENYKDASLTFLADSLGLSVSALSKIIKLHTGHTFKELLLEKRLARAEFLLRETSLPVTDIIFAVGYDNTSYFHKAFKSKYKLSPRGYRLSFGK